jgi:hypothetical protein
MKKFTVVGLVSAVAMLFASAAVGQGVVGEKLDSGLGNLTAADIRAYMSPYRVAGEKLDSGLGDLVAVRRAEEAPKSVPTAHSAIAANNPFHVPGEKLDSGLGELAAPAKRDFARTSF